MTVRSVSGPAALAALAILLALSAGGCGEKSEPEIREPPEAARVVPGGAEEADVRVIDAWARTLKRGDVDGAADYFAIPSVAENGPQLLRITEPAAARLFNASLPCGAVLTKAVDEGDFTVATFRLTERPGPGSCGDGTGNDAQTAFVIKDGKIVEWRRVGIGGPQAPSQST
jgi:hypothetical protein